jgi:hypothetical protein
MEITPALRVIGDEEMRTSDLTKAAPGTVVAIDQVLFEERGEPWDRGEPVGEAHGTAVATQKGVAVCHITFTFGEEDTIVAHGVLRIDGSTVGSGRLAIAGGTGQFNKAAGRLDVEHRNPKRWSFYL